MTEILLVAGGIVIFVVLHAVWFKARQFYRGMKAAHQRGDWSL